MLFILRMNLTQIMHNGSTAYHFQVIKPKTQKVQTQPASVLADPLAVFVRLSPQKNNSMPQRTAPMSPANAVTRRVLSFATAVYRDED